MTVKPALLGLWGLVLGLLDSVDPNRSVSAWACVRSAQGLSGWNGKSRCK